MGALVPILHTRGSDGLCGCLVTFTGSRVPLGFLELFTCSCLWREVVSLGFLDAQKEASRDWQIQAYMW